MKRRNFLFTTAMGGAAATIALSGSCKSASPDSNTINQGSDDFPLKECSVKQLQDWLNTGKFSSVQLVKLYLDRIQHLDKQGPCLNSIIEINPDALKIAEQFDRDRKSGKTYGPLHGIPLVIKDNINTADKMSTSAGSLALAHSKASSDAFIIKKLREAGAIILAKTNLSEWANFRSNRSSSGWSGRGGQTRNPYVLNYNPCGSSSGTGVAVSANLCALGIGTETDGSIICPSSMNGVVGIKPTLGVWSRSGIIPIAHSQDTAGPMARTVTDASVLLGILTGEDSQDPVTLQSRGKVFSDYTQFLDKNGLKDARIGIARDFFGFHERVDSLMEEVIAVLKKSGAVIIDPIRMDKLMEMGKAETIVLQYEFKADIRKYLSGISSDLNIRSLDDLIRFNKEHASEEMRYFGQEIFLESAKRGDLSDKIYLDALADLRKYSREEGIDLVMQKNNLDALIAPSCGPACVTDLVNGDHILGGSSGPAACAGYPSISVPAGQIEGLPVGISFFGKAWSEPQLIKYAYAFEEATKFRTPPQFRESI